MSENVADLIRDLTARLGAMAEEFGARADLVPRDEVAAIEAEESADLTQLAKRLLAHRRARAAFFPADLFHEPAWDMLIALFIARSDPRPLHVKALVASSHAPATTSQRWIDYLHKIGLVTRTIDPEDRRRVEVAITESGREAMALYLRSILPRHPA